MLVALRKLAPTSREKGGCRANFGETKISRTAAILPRIWVARLAYSATRGEVRAQNHRGRLYEALYYATLLHCAVSFRWLHIINKKTVA
jgi:hypothetical protein